MYRGITWRAGLTTLSSFCVFLSACGAPEVATSPSMDAVERELEVSRHGQLLERIAIASEGLNGFTTDGCSGGLSLAWEQFSGQFPEFADNHGNLPPWQACCVAHDRAYHGGGRDAHSASESFELRRAADLALRACVLQVGTDRSEDLRALYGLTTDQVASLYESVGDLMYRAVRLGGVPCTAEPWRWGYGWPECNAPSPDG